jgi:murein DD-endopeptidase MepM/ murein hydrolase activator NlpD
MRGGLVLLLCLVCGAAWAGSLELKGRLEQGAVVLGKTEPGARVLHDGQQVPVSDKGDFIIGFDRDAPPKSRLELLLPDGRKMVEVLEVKRRKYRIQRIDGLPPSKVTPRKKADLERIRRDIAATRKARSLVDGRTDYLSGFQWPAKGRVSGVYGSQRVLNGKPKRPHYGVDIAGPVGKPVRAPADGIITLAHPDMFYSGATLIMDHGQGLSSTFLHLNRILVKEGEQVRKGQIVAEMGATGRVTGPHLDWRMNLRGKRVDPQTVVPPMEINKTE